MFHRPALSGRLMAVLGVLAFGIAACSGGAASVSPPAVATASPTTGEASPAAISPGLPGDLFPSFTTDAELEARIPDEFCGQQTIKSSFSGADFVADDADFAAVVAELGRSPADVSVAAAGVTGPECVGINLIAFRIAGADSGQFEQLFIAAQARETGSEPARANVGGREVWSFTDTDGLVNYLYFSGDTVFGVTASTAEDAARGLAAMP